MSKNVIIAIVGTVILLGGGAAAYMATQSDTSKGTDNKATTTQNDTKQSDSQNIAEKGSVQEFLKAGANKKCTYSDGDQKGTIYFASNQRMRMDFESSGADAQSGGMIVLAGKQYMWDNKSKDGMTFAFVADASQQNQSTTGEGIDVNKEYDFKCENWSVDESKFTPPNDVTFRDLSQLMNGLQQPR